MSTKTCEHCNGHGQTRCPRCDTSWLVGDRGWVWVDDLVNGGQKQVLCTQCQGTAEVTCLSCHGSGEVPLSYAEVREQEREQEERDERIVDAIAWSNTDEGMEYMAKARVREIEERAKQKVEEEEKPSFFQVVVSTVVIVGPIILIGTLLERCNP